MFASKLSDGSLEIKIKKKENPYHGKLYLMYDKAGVVNQNKSPGTVIIGSSNLTWSGLIGQGELNNELKETKDFTDAECWL
jgi:HKD family nuclease